MTTNLIRIRDEQEDVSRINVGLQLFIRILSEIIKMSISHKMPQKSFNSDNIEWTENNLESDVGLVV
jgi:hypothetical protein